MINKTTNKTNARTSSAKPARSKGTVSTSVILLLAFLTCTCNGDVLPDIGTVPVENTISTGTVFPANLSTVKFRGYLVPDQDSQKSLGQLGFELRAPQSSFDAKIQANPTLETYFGGAHVSVFKGVSKHILDCSHQLQVAADYCRKNKWQLPRMHYHEGMYQPSYYFDESDIHTITLRDAAKVAIDGSGLGWSKAKDAKFHIGIYSSSLEQRPSKDVCEKMKSILMKAQWGFVLVRNRGGNDRNYGFDWNTWQKITA